MESINTQVIGKYTSSNVEVYGMLFSADYCPSCHEFVPHLKKVYQNLRDHNIEIIFVASDKTKEAFEKYRDEHHSQWQTMDYEDEERSRLRTTYGIKTIPALLFFHKDGTLVESNGRNLVVDMINMNSSEDEAARMIAERVGAIQQDYDSEDLDF